MTGLRRIRSRQRLASVPSRHARSLGGGSVRRVARSARVLAILAFILAALGVACLGKAAQVPAQPEYLVGVYYFSGWWREQPNKYFTAGHDWRADWPGRVPLLGEYNEQETMDREIAAAAANGVSFFQILWYPQNNPASGTGHLERLNEGVRLFMASTNSHRMKFTVEFVNHPPFQLESDPAWASACHEWCAAMKHPSYLRLGSRPVFKIHGADAFFNQNGRDPARVAQRLGTLRRIAHESGLPDLLISGGVGAGGVAIGPLVAAYDFLTTYMDMPNLPQRETPYPYSDLLRVRRRWMATLRAVEREALRALPPRRLGPASLERPSCFVRHAQPGAVD